MTQNNDALSFLMENGLSSDEISRYLNEGISMDELVTAVQGLTSRRESVNSDTQSVKPADFSDAGNAEVFAREYSSYLTFVDSMGWLFWDGKRWERSDHKALMLAIEFSSRMRIEAMEEYTSALHKEAAAKANNPDGGEEVKKAAEKTKQAKAFLAHANITRRAARIKAILELSKGEFVVMKTGVHPMRVKLKLFFKWGIEFDEKHPYTVPDNGGRTVEYVERKEIVDGIMKKYPPKRSGKEETRSTDAAPAGQEQSQRHEPKKAPASKPSEKKGGGEAMRPVPPSRRTPLNKQGGMPHEPS